jgi:hypothetical protein
MEAAARTTNNFLMAYPHKRVMGAAGQRHDSLARQP